MSEEKDIELREDIPEQTSATEDDALTDSVPVTEPAEEPSAVEAEQEEASSDDTEQEEASSDDTEQAEEASADAQEKPQTRKERIAYSLYDVASIVGTAVIAIMVAFTFIFRFVGVVGPSMQPTLYQDDWLAVTAMPIKPRAGDIVIITQPNAFDEPIVKRVIATAGQTVDIRDGFVYIDGEMLVEKYIAPDVYTDREDLDNYPLTIPEGQVFVLGDNRMHSTDSRSSAIGLIDSNYILGRVSFRMMPFGKWKVGMEYDYD